MIARVAAVLLALAASAAAQTPSRQELARQAIFRARRAFSVGPSVGLTGAAAIGGDHAFGGVTFGLALRAFAIGIPTAARIRELVAERIRAKVQERIRDAMARGEAEPSDADLAAYAKEISAEVRQKLIDDFYAAPRTWERPRFVADLEAGSWFAGANAWTIRAGAGIGLWLVTVGPTASVLGGSGRDAFLVGAEIGVHPLLGDGPRPPVLDLYVRAELPVNDVPIDAIVSLGARLVIDVL